MYGSQLAAAVFDSSSVSRASLCARRGSGADGNARARAARQRSFCIRFEKHALNRAQHDGARGRRTGGEKGVVAGCAKKTGTHPAHHTQRMVQSGLQHLEAQAGADEVFRVVFLTNGQRLCSRTAPGIAVGKAHLERMYQPWGRRGRPVKGHDRVQRDLGIPVVRLGTIVSFERLAQVPPALLHWGPGPRRDFVR